MSYKDTSPTADLDRLAEAVADQQISIRAHENLLLEAATDPFSPIFNRFSRRQQRLDPESVGELPPFRNRCNSLGRSARLQSLLTPSITTKATMPIKIDKLQAGESVEEWLGDFERKATANTWNDENKLRYLPCYLSGAPLHWFLDIEAKNAREAVRQPLRWDDIRARLLSAFADDSQQGWRAQLRERVQGPDEANGDYIYDVIRLCNKVNANMDELDKIQQIMSGLLPSILEKISMLDNQTMDQLVTNIKRAQTSRNMLQHRVRTSSLDKRSFVATIGEEKTKRSDDLEQKLNFILQELIDQRNAFVTVVQHQHQQHQQWQQQMLSVLQPQVHPPISQAACAPPHFSENVHVAALQQHPQQAQFTRSFSQPRWNNSKLQASNTGPDQGRNRARQRTLDGRPVCFLCKREGHVMLKCPRFEQACDAVRLVDEQGGGNQAAWQTGGTAYVQGIQASTDVVAGRPSVIDHLLDSPVPSCGSMLMPQSKQVSTECSTEVHAQGQHSQQINPLEMVRHSSLEDVNVDKTLVHDMFDRTQQLEPQVAVEVAVGQLIDLEQGDEENFPVDVVAIKIAGLLQILAQVEGQEVRALVDSGAAVSCVDDSLVSHLPHSVVTGLVLRAANHSLLRVVGRVHASVSVEGIDFPVSMIAVKGLSAPCILGNDFGYDNTATISYGNNMVSFTHAEGIIAAPIINTQ